MAAPLDVLTRPTRFVKETANVTAGLTRVTQVGSTYSQAGVMLLSPDWHDAGIMPGSLITRARGGASGITATSAVRVVGGHRYGTSSSLDNWSSIMRSTDGGKSWAEVYTSTAGIVYVMAFDVQLKKFYAQRMSADGTTIDVLESANGSDWSTVDSHAGPSWASPLLAATGTSAVTDQAGNIVPYGGLFGWKGRNSNLEIMISPQFEDAYDPTSNRSTSNAVDIITRITDPGGGATVTTTTATVPAMYQVRCVGYAGGTWYAGGIGDGSEGRIARSTNDGATWTTDYSDPFGNIECLMGTS